MGDQQELVNLEPVIRSSRRAQLTLFDVFLGVIQPAALVLVGAAVVNLNSLLYGFLLLIAVTILIFVQYSMALRGQADRSRELFSDYLQNRSNLLSILTALVTYSSSAKRLTKVSLLIAVETWFEEDLLHDYYWDQEIESRQGPKIGFRRKPFWKRWLRNSGRELTYVWYTFKARLRSQPDLELIDIVFHTPNEDIASFVIARALEEAFIEELLIPGDHPSAAHIEYVWSPNVVLLSDDKA